MTILGIPRTIFFSVIAGLVAIILIIAVATACSGSSGPLTATQILQSNGYAPSATYTSSLQSGFDGDGNVVTSSEAGTNNSGDVQAVVVFDNAADAQAGEAGIDSEFGGDGITVTSNGDVLTATGSVTAWAAIGNTS